MRAEVVAGIAPADGPDPRGIGEQRVRVGLAVEDEDKVGLGMQPVGEEELEVSPGFWALAVHVCDERAVVGLGGVWLFVLGDGDEGVVGDRDRRWALGSRCSICAPPNLVCLSVQSHGLFVVRHECIIPRLKGLTC